MASSSVVFPAPVAPVMANRPLLANARPVKSIFHSPFRELRFFQAQTEDFHTFSSSAVSVCTVWANSSCSRAALHLVNFGQRQPALEYLLHLQFTERLPLGVEQYFLALLAAARTSSTSTGRSSVSA
ncbi:Uncharacterised protein [Klebsiella pneumoniae]|uniref:Uncharacterized protein n=1 Tax=Klebsiella pneumoniae TaxID=573 RepID=A0A378FRC1_KLEPN|nr:Uncharacterised protein [Klebsiella pneumoniae]